MYDGIRGATTPREKETGRGEEGGGRKNGRCVAARLSSSLKLVKPRNSGGGMRLPGN